MLTALLPHFFFGGGAITLTGASSGTHVVGCCTCWGQVGFWICFETALSCAITPSFPRFAHTGLPFKGGSTIR